MSALYLRRRQPKAPSAMPITATTLGSGTGFPLESLS